MTQKTRKSTVKQSFLEITAKKQDQNNGNIDGHIKSKGKTSQDNSARQIQLPIDGRELASPRDEAPSCSQIKNDQT